ncbi:MAG TPA: hypothetical protein VES67_16090 [Vicinamibacterales bacterium]|nr:hypothetical protein [Vicinamibacterales bacterium]
MSSSSPNTSSGVRLIVRRAALAATVLGAVWTAGLMLFGGFDVTILGVGVSSHSPLRPFVWATLAFAVFGWINGLQATADQSRRLAARIDPRLVVAALVIWIVGSALARGTTVGFGADAYGYVSQADLWVEGALRQPQPWVDQVPWPNAAWTFSPLGYRPDESRGRAELVPTYSPGLPMLMALAKRIAGHCAMFWIVPLSGGVLVWVTYALGRRFGSSGAGLIGAWLVATSPAVLLALMRPMTDVPVAAVWTVAFVVVLAPGVGWSFLAGALAGLAVLIRPNLLPLAAILGAWVLVRAPRDGHDSGRAKLEPFSLPRRAKPANIARHSAQFRQPARQRKVRTALGSLVAFAAGLAPGLVVTGFVFNDLYGSPFVSGYGTFDQQLAWPNVARNFRNYMSWLIDSQSLLVVAGIAALLVPVRRLWPGVADRRVFWITGLFSVVLWAQFCFYLVFEDWGYLRFLLPFWPLVMLGMGSAAMAGLRSRRAFVVLATAWVILGLGVRGLAVVAERGVFDQWAGDSDYVGAAHAVQSVTEPNSVVLTLLHSGTVRYYGGRVTMRYDILDREWLDPAVAWLTARGVHVYALLDQAAIDDYRSEVEYFRQRFSGQQTVGRLNAPPVITYRGTRPILLYALSDVPPARAPRVPVGGSADLSCAPPAPRGRILLK